MSKLVQVCQYPDVFDSDWFFYLADPRDIGCDYTSNDYGSETAATMAAVEYVLRYEYEHHVTVDLYLYGDVTPCRGNELIEEERWQRFVATLDVERDERQMQREVV